MSVKLRLSLIIFSLIWLTIIISLIRKEKLPIRYSIVWIIVILIVLLIAIVPQILEFIADLFGFLTISNLVVGMILTMLLIITLSLTIIVSKQRKQIILLIQEISILESEKEK